jgi:small neutral amino acid transporter SnatA (MarC family)
VVLFLFLFFGTNILLLLGLSQQAIGIAGGIILFLIALKMIFESADEVFGGKLDGEPFIVPIAIPFIAGPSALATAILFSSHNPNYMIISGALTLAMSASCAIFLLGSKLTKIIGDKGLEAMQRLMGLVLTAMSVEMLIKGIKALF